MRKRQGARAPSPMRQFWRSMPLKSYVLFLAAVVCLYSTLGFLNDIESFGRSSGRALAIKVLLSGFTAAAFLLTTKHVRFFWLAIPLVALSIAWDGEGQAASADLDAAAVEAVRRRMKIDALATMIGIVLGYSCFIFFIVIEGKRYLRVQAEMALARDIHRVLAPPIDSRTDAFEFYGASHPSSEVGGDLADLVFKNGRWLAYIADVSGHGVASGTLMGMFKSAARSQLLIRMDPSALLTDLNQVILDLKKSSMFITCACLASSTEHTLDFVLAGHPPILHYRRAATAVSELSAVHLPLGLFEGQRYQTASVQFATGDLFVLLTDGLTEVFDTGGAELGLEPIKTVVATHADRPLPELFQAVLNQARRHGPQLDDQSLLIVRCL